MELYLLSLAQTSLQESAGIYIPGRPRRPARGRSLDLLALSLTIEGNHPLPADQQEQLLKRLAQKYYDTPGSVTAAMRTLAEMLNQTLLDRNLRGSSNGRQGIGILTILALREDRLTIGLCGPVQAFFIASNEVQHYYDPQTSRRGLGLGRSTPIYYGQVTISHGDALVISSQPPASWTPASLAPLHGQSPENLRMQLLNQADSATGGFLALARSGSEKIVTIRPKSGAQAMPAQSLPAVQTTVPAQPAASVQPYVSAQIEELVAPTEPARPSGELSFEPPAHPEDEVRELPREDRSPALPPTHSEERSVHQETPAVQPPPRRSRPTSPEQPAVPRLESRRVARALGQAGGHTLSALRTFLRRMLPGDGLFTLPTPAMIMTAVIVPLVVVTIATMAYFQRGITSQYQLYYTQAESAASTAQDAITPREQRQGWETVLQLVDQTESYQSTPESKALRDRALSALDALNLTRRLDYQPAIAGGLSSSSKIIRLAATASDLYLLDAQKGSIQRAFSTGRGYEIDDKFQCGPGLLGSQNIGALLDMQVLSDVSDGAPIVAGMDAGGNLLQCQAGMQPLFIQLVVPYTGWGQPSALAQEDGNLYILDAGKNAVWVFRGSAGKYTEQPAPYFTGDAPNLNSVIDIAVEKDDLYLLHADGHLTLCNASGFQGSPTACTEPAPYTDMRPGQEGLILLPTSAYIQIEDTSPPEPSLYLLQPGDYALHHYSLRLTFQRQLSPLGPASTARQATAFALSPDKRLVFLALGNEVFYAGMP